MGGSVPWRINDWRQETDGVRGGASSVSFKADTNIGVEMSGKLDPSKLGAAFAGMVLQEKLFPTPLKDVRGLVLDVERADGMEYSVSLKMQGAMAGCTHKFRFKADSPGKIEMPFADFVAVRRGKPDPSNPRLDPARIDQVILQVASDFGEQEGPFSITFRSIEGLEGQMEAEQEPAARTTRWKCPACDTLNFKGADACQRCGSPRVIVKETLRPGEVKPKPKKWECGGCGASNFPSAGECHKCGAPKP